MDKEHEPGGAPEAILDVAGTQVRVSLAPGVVHDGCVTAEALVACLRANSAPIRLPPRTEILDPVVFRSADFHHRIELNDIVFRRRVDLRDVTFHRTLDLRRCEFREGLVMEGASLHGSLLLDGATVGLAIDPEKAGRPGADGTLQDGKDKKRRAARLQVLRVRGDFLARGLRTDGGVDLTRADVGGRMVIASAEPGRLAIVRGPLVLNAARLGGTARFNALQLDGHFDAEGLRAGGSVLLGPLRQDNENDDGNVVARTVVNGNVVLSTARIAGELNLNSARVRGLINLQTARVRGGVFCRSKKGRRPLVCGDVHARGARISGTTDFSGARLCSELLLEGSRLEGPVFLRDGWLASEGAPDRASAAGWRRDLSPWVRGRIQLSYARVNGTIQIQRAKVGSVSLKGATVSGGVEIVACDVGGDIDLSSARVGSDVVIRGEIPRRLRDGRSPVGSERPLRTNVGGSVLAEAAWFDADFRLAATGVASHLHLAGSRVAGSVELGPLRKKSGLDTAAITNGDDLPAEEAGFDPRTHVGGDVDLSDTRVGGSIEAPEMVLRGGLALVRTNVRGAAELRGAVLRAPADASALPTTPPPRTRTADVFRSADKRSVVPARVALYGVGARIGASLSLNQMVAAGHVDLRHARIGNGLFAGEQLPDEGTPPSAGARVTGSFVLDAARVIGTADFRGTRVDDELSLERAVVEGKLRCPVPGTAEHAPAAGVNAVDLRNATVRDLELDPGTAVVAQPRLKFEGCSFQELSVPGDDYASLLDVEGVPFRRSTFVAMERWLRNRGDDDKAERVYALMQDLRRKSRGLVGRAGVWAVGMVRRVSLAFHWLIVASVIAFLVSAVVFSSPRSVVEVETEGARAAVPAPLQGLAEPKHPTQWGIGDALLFAARTHLPMLSLPAETRREPSDEAIRPGVFTLRYDAYATMISLLSYAIVPLVIGGIVSTWLERRRQP
jgi:hypothetical protein